MGNHTDAERGSTAQRLAALALTAVLICVALWAISASASGATPRAPTTNVFNFTGGEQTFTVPDRVTSIEVLAVGGGGGNAGSVPGGNGAEARATLPVTPGETLFIEVGGNGEPAVPAGADGGFNGGGDGGDPGMEPSGGGGGGATDIRTISRAGPGDSLGSRLIVAGGGGGAGGTESGDPSHGKGGSGGDAGAIASGNGREGESGGAADTSGGGPGTQTMGGASDFEAGTLGQGGGGSAGFSGAGGGGGGGGKFGGGGGDGGEHLDLGGGGGGGGSTSFVPTATDKRIATTTDPPTVAITYTPGGGGNSLKVGKAKLNTKEGTALLPVTAPGPGTLSIGGKGLVKKRLTLTRTIARAGTSELEVKTKGRTKRKLFAKGKVKVKAVVTFKPTSGEAVKATKTIKLKKR